MSHIGFDLLSSSSSKILAPSPSVAMAADAHPTITLYTSYQCPWAHRAHIALKELGLPFKEEIVDLSKPRTPEYLAINPRGLVPTLIYDGEVIPESAVVSQFLVDAHPSHLLKTSTEAGGALQRARVNFFVDAYFTKVHGNFYSLISTQGEEQEKEAEKTQAAIIKEIEPLLADAKPYFGGSSKLTYAEVLTGSFMIRLLAYTKHGLIPKSFSTLETRAPNFWKWANAVSREDSVTYIFDEQSIIDGTRARINGARAKAAK